jgi:carbonic anhydrase
MPIEQLIEGHQNFQQNFAREQSDYLRKLAEVGQSPDTLMVSCSDSRVIPELITSAAPGQLFIVRNVGNMVPPYATRNMTVGSALEYAIEHLGIKHIVVLGHYGCGAMAALRNVFGPGGKKEQGPLPDTPLLTWLQYAEASFHEAVQKGVLDTDQWLDTLVEENVLQQLSNMSEYPVVRTAVEKGGVSLHAWTYALDETALYFFNTETRTFVSSQEVAVRQTTGSMSLEQIAREDNVR